MSHEPLKRLRHRFAEHLDETRIRMARPGALISLSLLGLVTGVLAGGVIVLFRVLVEGTQREILPGARAADFESLAASGRFLLPLAAAVALAAMFRWFARGIHTLGIPYVLERIDRHQGRIGLRAFLLQFAGAVLAIVGGHSVGREGPNVFLGAASGSLLGARLALPHNVTRTLVGCGAAAGIAASFNTPLAGVVFALEVVMMEYTVSSFIPVILAAVSATMVSNAVFGNYPAFTLPAVEITSLWHLVPVAILGVTAGAFSAAFIGSVQLVTRRTASWPIELRILLAGLSMGLFGLLLPEVMGIGYDTVSSAMHGQYTVLFLLFLLMGKLLATSCVIGLGVPGGTIGPTLFIGAMLGAAFGGLFDQLPLSLQNPVGLFALLGLGAMMAGSLQAPLAALTAMLELTDHPGIILPGMLVVVISGLTASEVFGKDSQFHTMLRASGLKIGLDPVSQALRRIGVASAMDRGLLQVGRKISVEQARKLLQTHSRFLLIGGDAGGQILMPAAHLASWLEAETEDDRPEEIDLLAIPAQRLQAASIGLQANLQEAAEILAGDGVEALVVKRHSSTGADRVFGVLTPEMVERAYRH
ncbi:MAG: chloride channel protein [Xanthomonadales bacterium]